jgi:hypothetical protein
MLFIVWILTVFNLYAQNGIWTSISPLNECSEFKVDYTFNHQTSAYKLRFLLSDNPIVYEDYPTEITSLKDIANLNDLFKLKALNQCPEIISDINNNQCNGVIQKNIFSEDYIFFINLILKIAAQDNICEELLEYKKLQDEVISLKPDDFLNENKTKKFGQLFLKLFTDKDTDKLIDTFYACGGKKGSDTFVKNMVLIEARNACIVPSPPGYLSWEEAEKMATEMAKPYSNVSLMKMNFLKDQIEADAYMSFTETVVKKQIKDMVPDMDDQEIHKLMMNLESYKSLKSVIDESNHNKLKINGQKISKSAQKSDYLSYVFSIEAPFEIAELVLPELIKSNFYSKLPANWSENKKQDFLKNNLSDEALKEYEKCITPHKQKLNISQDYTKETVYDQDTHNLVNERKNIEKNFCEHNPNSCLLQNCSKSVNFLSQDTKVTDMQKIQSCAYAGIIKTLPPMFDAIIAETAEEMKNEIKFDGNSVKSFSSNIWNEMAKCLNESSFEKKQNHIFPDETATNELIYSTLEMYNSSDFENLLFKCSDHAEDEAARGFIQQVLLNTPALKTFYPVKQGEPTIGLWGAEYSSKQYETVNRVIREAYEPCIEQQYNIVNDKVINYKLDNKDPTLCTPLIEIKSAEIIIEETILEELKEIKMDKDPIALSHIKTFHSCTLSSFQRAHSAIGSTSDEHKITDTKSANEYLDKDNTFYQCMNTLITNVSGVIAGYEFDKLMNDPKNGLTNVKQYKKERPNIITTTQACISNELNTIGNWPKFVKFLETSSFDNITSKCSLEATKFILPTIIVSETNKTLKELTSKKEEILIPSQINEILKLTAKDLRNKFNVTLPSNLPANEVVEYSIKEAYANFEKSQISNPQKFCPYDGKEKTSIEEFVCYYEDRTVLHVMEKLHSNLETMANAKSSLVSKEFKATFWKNFTPQCMQNLYFPKELAKLPSDPESTVSTFDSLVEQIADGFKYINKLNEPARSQAFKDVETICKDSARFKDLKPLKTYKGFDFILKAQIQKQTIASLRESIETTYKNELEQYKNDPDHKIYESFAYIKRSDSLLAITKHLEDPKKFEALVFNDDTIISYLKNNFIEVQTEGSAEGTTLNTMVTDKIFKPRELNTFASDFIEAQIVGGIGIGGFKDALKSTIEAAGDDASILGPHASINAIKKATAKLRSLWTPTYMEKTLDWKSVNESTRKNIIATIYDNAILPAAKNLDGDDDKITDRINKHVDEYSYPNYPKDEKGNRTMKAKISEDVGEDIHWYNVIDVRDFSPIFFPSIRF